MAVTTLSLEAFWSLSQQPAYADKQLELIKGRLDVMPPSSGRNAEIALNVGFLLKLYLRDHPIGKATGADGGYVLAPDTVRVPDVGFITHERIPEEPFVFYPVAPDLAVEVLSPSESPSMIASKIRAYLEAGTRQVWAVHPDEQSVDVHTLREDGAIITQRMTDTLTGGDLLPEFSIPVSAIFD